MPKRRSTDALSDALSAGIRESPPTSPPEAPAPEADTSPAEHPEDREGQTERPPGHYKRTGAGYTRAGGEKITRVSLYLPDAQARRLKLDAHIRGFSGPAAYVAHLAMLDREKGEDAPPLPRRR